MRGGTHRAQGQREVIDNCSHLNEIDSPPASAKATAGKPH